MRMGNPMIKNNNSQAESVSFCPRDITIKTSGITSRPSKTIFHQVMIGYHFFKITRRATRPPNTGMATTRVRLRTPVSEQGKEMIPDVHDRNDYTEQMF